MSLRLRLFITYAVVVLVFLVVIALGVTLLMRNYVDRQSLSRLDDMTRPIYVQICMLSAPLRQLREGEEWTVSGELSWLQGGSRVREGEKSGCRKPGLDTIRLMAALES